MDEQEKAARFEQQSLAFFESREQAEAFWRLEDTSQRLETIWSLPIMQDLLKKNTTAVHEKSLGGYSGQMETFIVRYNSYWIIFNSTVE